MMYFNRPVAEYLQNEHTPFLIDVPRGNATHTQVTPYKSTSNYRYHSTSPLKREALGPKPIGHFTTLWSTKRHRWSQNICRIDGLFNVGFALGYLVSTKVSSVFISKSLNQKLAHIKTRELTGGYCGQGKYRF